MRKVRMILGTVLLLAMLAVFYAKRIAIYEDITLNSREPLDTLVLKPGDCLTQEMYLPYDYLDRISVALSFQEEISQDAEVLVEITGDGGSFMSQALHVNACPDGGFVDFHVGLDHCGGETVTLSVANVTPDTVPGGEFALLSTDKEFLFLDAVSTCRINDRETGNCILCRAVYRRGYSYYESATWAFLLFLVGCIIMKQITVHWNKR